jgi:hypothetical protein
MTMKARNALSVLAIALLALSTPGRAQDIADVMDGRVQGAFDGLTPENLAARLRPYVEQAEREKTDELRARDYVFLAQVVDGRMTDPESQHVTIEFADKALALKLSPQDRADMLCRKGSAMRKMHMGDSGEALRAPRREIATLWLDAYKVVLTRKNELAEEFTRDHPDFNPNAPLSGFQSVFILSTAPYTGPPPEMIEHDKLLTRYREMKDLERWLHRMQDPLADLYAHVPYDMDELKSRVIRIIGDAALADSLASRAAAEAARPEISVFLHTLGGCAVGIHVAVQSTDTASR